MTQTNALINKPAPLRKKSGVRQLLKHELKIDMTPMVDLGFLLISFFVITAELSKPRVALLNMPKDGDSSNIANSLALTILIGKDRLFYYHGDWPGAIKTNQVIETSFSYSDGLGRVIRDKQKLLDKLKHDQDGRKGLMLLIKPGDESTYENVVNVLDEIIINAVKKYAIVKPTTGEIQFIISQK